MMKRIAVMAALLLAALGVFATPASADPQLVAWYVFYGDQPSWHCNNSSTFNLGSQGTIYVMACVSISGEYEQGLYTVYFTKTHNDVVMRIQNVAPVNPPSQYAPFDKNVGVPSERTCDSAVLANTSMNCFAQTIHDSIHMYAQALSFNVDGVIVHLGSPTTGPSQVHSPLS